MSVAIVGKLLGGFIVSSGGVAAIAYMVMNSTPYTPLSETESENIYIYAISKEITNEPNTIQPAEDIKTGEDEKNYQCKFNDKDYECIISATKEFATDKKQANIDDLKAVATSTITKDELKSKDKIYKILINSSFKDWTKSDKLSIYIIPNKLNKETDKSKKYASLKPLFSLTSEYKPDPVTKTKYFVVKSKSTVNSDATATSIAYKCSILKEHTVTSKDEDCYVYDFSDNTVADKSWHEINFKKPTPKTNVKVEANKYYLVELTAEVEGITNIKISNNSSNPDVDVVLEDSAPIPAIRDKEDGDNIFILKKADVTVQPASGGGGS